MSRDIPYPAVSAPCVLEGFVVKLVLFALACLGTSFDEEARIASELKPLTEHEVGQWVGKVRPHIKIEKSVILRGLISSQTALRADCARYLAEHGSLNDVPYLIDALSDESGHVGANYPYSGMATTRYCANVALICITKSDFGFRWDEEIGKRKEAIKRWTWHWGYIKRTLKNRDKQLNKKQPSGK